MSSSSSTMKALKVFCRDAKISLKTAEQMTKKQLSMEMDHLEYSSKQKKVVFQQWALREADSDEEDVIPRKKLKPFERFCVDSKMSKRDAEELNKRHLVAKMNSLKYSESKQKKVLQEWALGENDDSDSDSDSDDSFALPDDSPPPVTKAKKKVKAPEVPTVKQKAPVIPKKKSSGAPIKKFKEAPKKKANATPKKKVKAAKHPAKKTKAINVDDVDEAEEEEGTASTEQSGSGTTLGTQQPQQHINDEFQFSEHSETGAPLGAPGVKKIAKKGGIARPMKAAAPTKAVPRNNSGLPAAAVPKSPGNDLLLGEVLNKHANIIKDMQQQYPNLTITTCMSPNGTVSITNASVNSGETMSTRPTLKRKTSKNKKHGKSLLRPLEALFPDLGDKKKNKANINDSGHTATTSSESQPQQAPTQQQQQQRSATPLRRGSVPQSPQVVDPLGGGSLHGGAGGTVRGGRRRSVIPGQPPPPNFVSPGPPPETPTRKMNLNNINQHLNGGSPPPATPNKKNMSMNPNQQLNGSSMHGNRAAAAAVRRASQVPMTPPPQTPNKKYMNPNNHHNNNNTNQQLNGSMHGNRAAAAAARRANQVPMTPPPPPSQTPTYQKNNYPNQQVLNGSMHGARAATTLRRASQTTTASPQQQQQQRPSSPTKMRTSSPTKMRTSSPTKLRPSSPTKMRQQRGDPLGGSTHGARQRGDPLGGSTHGARQRDPLGGSTHGARQRDPLGGSTHGARQQRGDPLGGSTHGNRAAGTTTLPSPSPTQKPQKHKPQRLDPLGGSAHYRGTVRGGKRRATTPVRGASPSRNRELNGSNHSSRGGRRASIAPPPIRRGVPVL